MRERLQVKDLIDLEYLLHLDGTIEEGAALGERDQRDRNIYLSDIRPKLDKKVLEGSEKRKQILRQWLECRKKIEEARGAVLPGELFTQAYTLLSRLFIVAGGGLGAAAALSLLVYSGERPVNVTLYFSVLVLMQMVLLLVLAGYVSVWRKGKKERGLSVFQPLIGALFAKLLTRAREGFLEKTGKEQRSSILYVASLVRGRTRMYGSFFHWPLFMLAQVFGISFNIGVLFATLLRVLSVDLAFGWQSTVQLGSTAVYRIVSLLSLPWAWALPSHISHPTLDQISGSRMVLKEGIYHLTTGDLVSWWPFLCLAVLFYGLLPRVVLFGAARIALNRSLSRFGFNTIACERLLHRLTTPLFNMKGSRSGSGVSAAPGMGRASMAPNGFRAKDAGAPKEAPRERRSRGIEGQMKGPSIGRVPKSGRGTPLVESPGKSVLPAGKPLYEAAGSMGLDKTEQASMESDRIYPYHQTGLKSGNGSIAESPALDRPADSKAAGMEEGQKGAPESAQAFDRKSLSKAETGNHPEGSRELDDPYAGKKAPYPPEELPGDGLTAAGELDRGDLAEKSVKENHHDPAVYYEQAPVSEETTETEAEHVPVLVSEDIIDECPDRELETAVLGNFGYRLAGIHSVSFDLDEDEALLMPLVREIREKERPRVFVLQEGWQPPIRETLLFYRGLRELLGEDTLIFVGLIGKPVPDTIFTRVDEDNLRVWNREMGKLADPALLVERLEYP